MHKPTVKARSPCGERPNSLKELDIRAKPVCGKPAAAERPCFQETRRIERAAPVPVYAPCETRRLLVPPAFWASSIACEDGHPISANSKAKQGVFIYPLVRAIISLYFARPRLNVLLSRFSLTLVIALNLECVDCNIAICARP